MAKASNNEFPSVLFGEQSSAPSTPSAGTARLYVDNAATPQLKLIDDAATITTFGSGGGGGGPTVVYKTADESVSSSTTLQNDDHLTIAVSANDVWLIEGTLFPESTSGTPDIKFDWSLPSGATGYHAVMGPGTAATSIPTTTQWGAIAVGTAFPVGVIASGTTRHPILVRLFVEIGGTGGSVTLQWAQNTSDAANTTLKKGSFLVAHDVT